MAGFFKNRIFVIATILIGALAVAGSCNASSLNKNSLEKEGEGFYTIQAGTYHYSPYAVEQLTFIRDRLNNQEIPYVRVIEVRDLFTVRVGKFADRADVNHYLHLLRALYPDAFILTVKNERVFRVLKRGKSDSALSASAVNVSHSVAPRLAPETIEKIVSKAAIDTGIDTDLTIGLSNILTSDEDFTAETRDGASLKALIETIFAKFISDKEVSSVMQEAYALDQIIQEEQKNQFVVEATAYTNDPWSINVAKYRDGLTAIRTRARIGVCAADWDVFPVGTVLYIEGHGPCIVEDRGGAIKGMKVDIFYYHYKEALQYGRRRGVTVYVIKKA